MAATGVRFVGFQRGSRSFFPAPRGRILLKESDEPKGSYLLLLQDAERNLRCKAVPGSGYKILVSILAAEDRFIDAPVGVPVHFVKDSRKCHREIIMEIIQKLA